MSKWTTADIPDQSGRTIVVTGANTGLGFATASALAVAGAHVVLAVRNVDKGKAAAERITAAHPDASTAVHELDLGSLASVRAAATDLQSSHPRIDVLINNAAAMMTPKSTTPDGFELQFGTNHLGHFAFTGLLLPQLLTVENSRVMTVSSMSHRMRAAIHFDDLQWERRYSRLGAYSQAKLANLMFGYELHRRLQAASAPTISVAAHPGLANTDLARNMPGALEGPMKWVAGHLGQSPAMGALPSLRAATDPTARGGQYYGPDRFEARGHPVVVSSSKQSRDADLQRRLWTVSEDLTGVTFPV